MKSTLTRKPSLEGLNAALALDADAGVLRWRNDARTAAGRLTSTRAGSAASGKSGMVKVEGIYVSALSVAWILALGYMPIGAVVPIDGDRTNLRPGNLLDCGRLHAPVDAPRLSINEALTADEAREIFSYDSVSGILRWRADRRSSRGYFTARAGHKVGGADKKGYLVLALQPPRSPRALHYFVHRIIWLIVTGAWPAAEVDHRNGNKADNRWRNLRHADDELNSQNRRRANRNNATGFLGVTLHKASGLFVSRIGHRGRIHILGKHATAQEAHDVYVEAKRRLHAGGTL